VFSDERFPALYYPPVPSYEALAGTLAYVTPLAAPAIVYLVVPPLGAVASVLALWRLLRCWRVALVAPALSVALAFLLLDAQEHRMFGAYFVARLWQGKALFLCILVPLIFALLREHGERPGARGIALLAAAGIAAVGLSTSAIFVVPVIAVGCLAPLAARAPGDAARALLAVAGYPLAVGVVTLAIGGRTPDVYTAAQLAPGVLAHLVLGTGVPAALAVLAVLVGPLLLGARRASLMVAATALVVGCLLAPRVPLGIFELTGLGRVLWRLGWALPVAALVGVLATGLVAREHPLWLRLLPAAAIVLALALGGHALWSSSRARVASELAGRPAWKLPAARLEHRARGARPRARGRPRARTRRAQLGTDGDRRRRQHGQPAPLLHARAARRARGARAAAAAAPAAGQRRVARDRARARPRDRRCARSASTSPARGAPPRERASCSCTRATGGAWPGRARSLVSRPARERPPTSIPSPPFSHRAPRSSCQARPRGARRRGRAERLNRARHAPPPRPRRRRCRHRRAAAARGRRSRRRAAPCRGDRRAGARAPSRACRRRGPGGAR
jgi:hypothetical protein